MIYLDIHGRLGNQLFQYAYVRHLMKQIQEKRLTINFQSFINESKGQGQTGWEDNLRFFKTVNYIKFEEKTCKNTLRFFFTVAHGTYTKIIILFYFVLRKAVRFIPHGNILMHGYSDYLKKRNIYIEDVQCSNFSPKANYDILVKGYFENPELFADVRRELMSEIVPKRLSKNAMDMINRITECESICLSIRTYNEIKHDPTWFAKYNVCDESYFIKGMDYITDKTVNPVFFLFSDDTEWVMKNYNFEKYKVVVCDCFDNSAEALHVMSHCRHFIISNSTYSWWAQYLSKNTRKMIVCPKMWNKDFTDYPLIDKTNWKLF